MDDIAQLKKQLDDIVFTLRRRLTDASERKAKAEKEIDSSRKEIEVVSKALDDFKPLQGYYGLLSAVQAVAPKPAPGSNRKNVVEILVKRGIPMTNAEIAKVAFEQGKIKSKKGYHGVYATVATVLSRGKNVFVNLHGQWDLRQHRDVKPPSPTATHGDRMTIVKGAMVPIEIARLKAGDG